MTLVAIPVRNQERVEKSLDDRQITERWEHAHAYGMNSGQKSRAQSISACV